MPDEMNFSFLDTFRLKSEKPKVFTPKMFPTKLTKLQVGITFFLSKYPTANIVYPEFREKSFPTILGVGQAQGHFPLPSSVLDSS